MAVASPPVLIISLAALLLLFLPTGCTVHNYYQAQPTANLGPSSSPFPEAPSPQTAYDLNGWWDWEQNSNRWHGTLYIDQDNHTFTGLLKCPMEGNYTDKLVKGEVQGRTLSFKRNGYYGPQYWKGEIQKGDQGLQIINGYWRKTDRSGEGIWTATKQ